MKQTELSRLIRPLAGRKPVLKPSNVWDPELDRQIAAAPLSVFGHEAGAQKAYALAAKSGLHLWNDSLDRSHTLSQDIHNATGGYWHGIMHRMEGDYWNAKYWFRQVGRHTVFAKLAERAEHAFSAWTSSADSGSQVYRGMQKLFAGNSWDPYAFIDSVEEHVRFGKDSSVSDLLLNVQREEFALLLAYCYENSGGGSIVELA